MPNTRNLLFDAVEERVHAYIGHPYLRLCQVSQAVSRFHFEVAYAILSAANVDEKTTQDVLEAVLLLEQGLSIHDDVEKMTGVLRQLTVLAGDYNSSQYYYILAGLGDLELLFRLSEAITRINGAKMKLNQTKERLNPEVYLTLQEIIHGSLLKSLAEHFLGANGAWMPHIQTLVKTYVVQDEMVYNRSPRFFTFRQAYEWLSDSFERVRLMPPSTFVGPIYNFLVEYFLPIQNALESLNFAEGNR